MEVLSTSLEWMAAFYEGHLQVYALVAAPEQAYSERRGGQKVACSDDDKSYEMLVVMTAKNRFQRADAPL